MALGIKSRNSIVLASMGEGGASERFASGGNYTYGLDSDSGVAFHLIGNQASGNWTDTKAGVVLTANGTPSYQQSVGSPWAASVQGVKFNANLDYFDNNSLIAAAGLGTTDDTIEWVMKVGTTVQDTNVAYAYTAANHGYILMLQAIGKSYFYFEATDATALTAQFNMSNIFDNRFHKHRLVLSGRGTGGAVLTYYIDGATQDTPLAITTLNAKTIPAGRFMVGWNQTTAYKSDATLAEFRLSNNSSANSGGPGGG